MILSLTVAFTGTLIMGWPTVVNWRRLGRPGYSNATLLACLVLLVTLPALGMLLHLHNLNTEALFLVAMTVMAVCVANGSLVVQKQGYPLWDAYDPRPLLRHQYRWDNAMLAGLVCLIVCLVGVFAIYMTTPPFVRYEHNDLTLSYPSRWQVRNCNLVIQAACVIALEPPNGLHTPSLQVFRYPMDDWPTLDEVVASKLDDYWAMTPMRSLNGITPTQVGGRDARVMDTVNNDPACDIGIRRYFFLDNGWVYQVNSQNCQSVWETHDRLWIAWSPA